MIAVGSLIEALRNEPFPGSGVEASDLERAHKFEVRQPGLLRDENVHRYGDLLVDAGLARLPFPACWFEFSNFAGFGPGLANLRRLGIFAEQCDAGEGRAVVVCVPFAQLTNSPWLWDYYAACSGWRIGAQAGEGFSNYSPAIDPREGRVLPEGSSDAQAALMARFWLADALAFLDLKETRSERVTVSDAVAARRAREGRMPLYSHTVLTVSRQTREALRAKGEALLERRAHWRRGHLRRLPDRVVPVAPALVRGAGFVSKDYRV